MLVHAQLRGHDSRPKFIASRHSPRIFFEEDSDLEPPMKRARATQEVTGGMDPFIGLVSLVNRDYVLVVESSNEKPMKKQ